MNKKEFVKLLAKDLDWSISKTDKFLEGFFNLVSEVLVREGKLSLFKFGIFTVRHKASRKGRNPKTGDELVLPPKDYPYFKASKSIVNAINKR